MKKNGVKHSMQPDVISRRIRAKERLATQLKLGKKNTNEGPVDLNESDIKRIKREIEILSSRIPTYKS